MIPIPELLAEIAAAPASTAPEGKRLTAEEFAVGIENARTLKSFITSRMILWLLSDRARLAEEVGRLRDTSQHARRYLLAHAETLRRNGMLFLSKEPTNIAESLRPSEPPDVR